MHGQNHGHGFTKVLAMVAWLITAIAAIHLGLVALGYNVFAAPMLVDHFGRFFYIVPFVVGALGVVSLVLFGLACAGCDCKGDCNCDTKNHR